MDSRQIEERAGRWLVRRNGADWCERDEGEFQSWLEASTAHVVAFVRLEAAWKQTERLKALGGGVPAGRVPSLKDWRLTRFFDTAASAHALVQPGHESEVPTRRRARVLALAASALLALIAALAGYFRSSGQEFSTPVGGLASVPMSDGSKVTLNTASQIRVAITEKERGVELRQGEAFFEVARDPDRPFVVTVGHKRVIAVGTAFSVRRNGDGVHVAVTQGRVRVEDVAQRSAATEQADDLPLMLSAGSTALASDAGILVQRKAIPEIESELTWRGGYLIFRDTALLDAAGEFNRYNARKIVIEDPSTAAIRVSGKFRSTQVEAFVRLLEDGFALRARNVDDRIILTNPQNEEGAVPQGP